jgi:hypothetical protein
MVAANCVSFTDTFCIPAAFRWSKYFYIMPEMTGYAMLYAIKNRFLSEHWECKPVVYIF